MKFCSYRRQTMVASLALPHGLATVATFYSWLKRMYQQLKQILEMIRFSHTLFALPFAMLSAVMSQASVP